MRKKEGVMLLDRRPVVKNGSVAFDVIPSGAIERAIDRRAAAMKKNNVFRFRVFARFAMLHVMEGCVGLYYTVNPDTITEKRADYIRALDSRYDREVMKYLKEHRGPCVYFDAGTQNGQTWVKEFRDSKPEPGLVWPIVTCDQMGMTKRSQDDLNFMASNPAIYKEYAWEVDAEEDGTSGGLEE